MSQKEETTPSSSGTYSVTQHRLSLLYYQNLETGTTMHFSNIPPLTPHVVPCIIGTATHIKPLSHVPGKTKSNLVADNTSSMCPSTVEDRGAKVFNSNPANSISLGVWKELAGT